MGFLPPVVQELVKLTINAGEKNTKQQAPAKRRNAIPSFPTSQELLRPPPEVKTHSKLGC